MNDKSEIEITAKNSTEFSKIEVLLSALPKRVLNQVESAKLSFMGLELIYKQQYNDKIDVILPNGVTQICHFDTYIGIYCQNYFIKLTGYLFEHEKNLNYTFLNK